MQCGIGEVWIIRSSHRMCSIKKPVLKNFAMSARLESLFNKVAGLRAVFSCAYCEFFKNTYFKKHLRTAVSGISGFMRICVKKCSYINFMGFPFEGSVLKLAIPNDY